MPNGALVRVGSERNASVVDVVTIVAALAGGVDVAEVGHFGKMLSVSEWEASKPRGGRRA